MTDPVSPHPHQAQQSLDLIQEELSKETGNADLIENSMSQTVRVIGQSGRCTKRLFCEATCDSSQPVNLLKEEVDRKVKMTPGLTQTVRELQLLIQNVNQQLTKGQDAVRPGFLGVLTGCCIDALSIGCACWESSSKHLFCFVFPLFQEADKDLPEV